MDKDLAQSFVRMVLNGIAGAAVAHGYMKSDSINQMAIEWAAGAIVAAISLILSKYHQNQMKGNQ